MLAVRLVTLMKRQGIEIDNVTEIFHHPTIADIAIFASRTRPNTGSGIITIRESGTREPLFLFHEMTGTDIYFHPLTTRLDASIPVYGLTGPPLNEGQPQSMEAIAKRFLRIIRETKPLGPYSLAGWSFGGAVAYEAARQLIHAGEKVDFLALLDTVHPAFWRMSNEHTRSFSKDSLLGQVRAEHEFEQAEVIKDLELIADDSTIDVLIARCREWSILPSLLESYSNLEIEQLHSARCACQSIP